MENILKKNLNSEIREHREKSYASRKYNYY